MSLSRSRYVFLKRYHSKIKYYLEPCASVYFREYGLIEYKPEATEIMGREIKSSIAFYTNLSRALKFSCLLSYTMSNARVWSLIRTYFWDSNYKILLFTRDRARRLRAYIPRGRRFIDSFKNRMMLSMSVSHHETYEQAFESVEICHHLSTIFNELTFGGFFLHGTFYTYDNYKKLQQRIMQFRIADLYTLWWVRSAELYFIVISKIVEEVYTLVTTRVFSNKSFSVLKEVGY